MLADLVLADLPFEVLITLKHAINDEILLRKKQQYLTRQLRHFQRTSAKPPRILSRSMKLSQRLLI